jgi:peptide-methionine (S)-S-oxide reductase
MDITTNPTRPQPYVCTPAALGRLAVAIAACFLLATPANASTDPTHGARTEKVVLAGGCFWGMEAVFESLKGVSNVTAGFAGGSKETAHYEVVSTGATGHAESVEIAFDPSRVSFAQILKVYFLVAHDPTELNRQGPDDGTQYRSEIFYTTPEQKRAAEAYVRQLESAKTFSAPIVTKIEPLHGFYAAEEYHQHFVQRNPNYPYVVVNDLPKLRELHQRFPDLVKSST